MHSRLALVLSVVSAVQTFTSHGLVYWLFPTGYEDFVLGPFVYHNQYAGFIELILPLALVGALEDRRRMPACAAIAAAMYASVIAAASRAGAILATAEILVIVLIAFRRGRSPLRSRAVTLGVLASLAILFTAIAGSEVLLSSFIIADPISVRR